ncbi:MAG: integrase core domain-containing protein, partial [Tannerella sp.]|nr:integrase core domain-containing protein [Tannerella sp.]
AQAERINGTMKNELLKGAVFQSLEEVTAAVRVSVDFYNNGRPHLSLNMMTPCRAAGCTGEITKRWTSYRQLAIQSKHTVPHYSRSGVSIRWYIPR